MPWDAQGEARAALRTIVADPRYGPAAVGFGIQTILLFAGYQFYVRSPDHPGPGGAVGILGGLLLLVAGLIAAASRPASTAVTGGP